MQYVYPIWVTVFTPMVFEGEIYWIPSKYPMWEPESIVCISIIPN